MKIYIFLKFLIVLSLFLLSGSVIKYITSFSYEALTSISQNEFQNDFEKEYRPSIDFNKLLGSELVASAYNNDITDEVIELIKKDTEFSDTPEQVVVVVEQKLKPKKLKRPEKKDKKKSLKKTQKKVEAKIAQVKPIEIAPKEIPKEIKKPTRKVEEVQMEIYTNDIRGVVIERTDVEINNRQMTHHHGFDFSEDEEKLGTNLMTLYQKIDIEGKLAILAENERRELEESEKLKELAKEKNAIVNNQKEVTQEIDMVHNELSSHEKDHVRPINDEIIIMDYSDDVPSEYSLDSNIVNDVIQKNELSHHVMGAISRSKEEVDKNIKQHKNVRNVESVSTSMSSTQALVSALTGVHKMNVNIHDSKYSSTVTMNAIDVDIQKGTNEKSFNFEFVPEYDNNDFVRDEQGVIAFREDIKDRSGTIRGTFVKRGKLRTKVDVVMALGDSSLTVPLLDSEQILKILEQENLNLGGGFVLVELEESVIEVDMDGQYQGIFFFDQNLKLVKEEDAFYYKLFTGVEPGNRLLSFATTTNEVAQKIIHVVEDEVYFEIGLLDTGEKREIELFEKNLMGATKAELAINENFINYFNRKMPSKKIALNRYELNIPVRSTGTRSYVEMSHLGEPIYVGFDDAGKIEVPSRDFIEKMMAVHDIKTLEGLCVVQLNISEELKMVKAQGETYKGPMNLKVTYLDKDGLFNHEPTVVADKVFLIGDLQGIMNIKIDYLSGKSDYLKTFCSEESYLVEQL